MKMNKLRTRASVKTHIIIIVFYSVFISMLIGIAVWGILLFHSPTHPVHTPPPSRNHIVPNSANIPSYGHLQFGMDLGNFTTNYIEDQINYKLNLVGWFGQWNDNLGGNRLTNACNQGYVPLITWQSWNGQNTSGTYSLSDIAAGKYDSLIKQNIESIKNICSSDTVIIRFDHEMDTTPGTVLYAPWQGDPTNYIAAWKHVVSVSRSIDPNIKWLWSPNRADSTSALYYPGAQWVDYVGVTMNRAQAEESIPTFNEFYLQNVGIAQYDKPILIGETAFYDDGTPTDKAAWIDTMFSYIKGNNNIVGIVWFNSGASPYNYNSSPQSIQAFSQNLKMFRP